ncbi:uncharacterized protein PFL1_00054 [Pseudozyma flocculosa PF-1]|uniref:uncharacterized protein n=1 Tax=Pseudozyma flocculosa PF-1 TaxID=1277687 RepID=UPI0004560DA7|nr:uncharacterized protein PFL1_00054 [Pseudozyma flocculosa PF-1]EPQ31855.1 hypothetical protein PFL1_00054 [Pseudozyma flocculosa PF-1]
MSQALRKRRSLGTSRPAHSSARPQPITSAQQHARLDPDEEAERVQREQELRRRRQKRRLDELERANYRDAPTALSLPSDDLPLPIATTSDVTVGTKPPSGGVDATSRKRINAEVKRILSTRKGFNAMLEEATATTAAGDASSSGPNYLSAAARPSRYPSRPLCSICGYWGSVACTRCGERYCSRSCGQTHDETRCDRPVR